MLVVDVELDRLRGGEQVLVVQELVAVEVGGDVALAVVHHHQVADPLERRQQRREQTEQRAVDEDHLVVGVVDDVGELLGEQSDVQRVQDAPGARRGEVQLEVAGGVPPERRHAAVGRDAEVVEDPAEPPGPLGPAAVVRALQPGPRRGGDLLVGEELLRSSEQMWNDEWNVLHEALHAPEGSAARRCPRYRQVIVSDAAELELDEPPHVRPSWAPLTLVAFVALVICTNIANGVWAKWVNTNPSGLLILSSRNRYLALTLASGVPLGSFVLIATARITAAFVVCHMIGRAYRDDAIGWFTKYLGVTKESIDTFNRGFAKAEWAIIPFFVGSNIVAALSGVHRTRPVRLARPAGDRHRRATPADLVDGAHVRGPAGDDPGMAGEVPVVGRRHLDRHRRAGERAQPPSRLTCSVTWYNDIHG